MRQRNKWVTAMLLYGILGLLAIQIKSDCLWLMGMVGEYFCWFASKRGA